MTSHHQEDHLHCHPRTLRGGSQLELVRAGSVTFIFSISAKIILLITTFYWEDFIVGKFYLFIEIKTSLKTKLLTFQIWTQ